MAVTKTEEEEFNRVLRVFELVMMFAVMPVIIWQAEARMVLFTVLWGGLIYAVTIMRWRYGFSFKKELNLSAVNRGNLFPIFKRFAVCAVLITLFTLVYEPQRFLSFPLERPGVWLLVMCFYPMLSALPQEVIYRTFFYRRYERLLPERWCIFLSSLAFALAHIMFLNWIAPVLCFIGGWIFCLTYEKTRSLALVWIEHAMYGCFVFTIGLGWYFYSGGAAAAG